MLEELLSKLKMEGALQSLQSVNKSSTSKESFTIGLLQAEVEHREHRLGKRRLSQAKFPTEKEWFDIDPDLNPGIDFTKVKDLGDGSFVSERKNLCLLGQQGTGKTHSLVALGRQLCRKRITVKFYTACGLVNELEEAKNNHKIQSFMQSLLRPQLLIIDELGFIPFSESGARLLFDVFTSRYERGSIAVSSNLSLDKWIEVFGSVELTGALLDRFTHNCHIFTYTGESVRMMHAEKRLLK